jgi:hypothetical protein
MSHKFNIITPQFTRPPGEPTPASPLENWSDLDQLDRTALREMGFGGWNAPPGTGDDDPKDAERFGGMQLLLIPGEWYAHIPEGTSIVSIMGERETFKRGETDDDIRFGCLAYGVLRPF